MIHSSNPPHDLPSTNAPYLLALWSEVICADLKQGPLWAINRAYDLPDEVGVFLVKGEREGRRAIAGRNGNGNGKGWEGNGEGKVQVQVQVKVDLVKDGGRVWMKVNT